MLTTIYSAYRLIPLRRIAMLRYVVMTFNDYVMHMLHLTPAPATPCTSPVGFSPETHRQMVSRLTCICLALRSQLPVMPLLASTHAVNLGITSYATLGVKHVPTPFMSYLPPPAETLSKTCGFSIAGEPWASAKAQSLDAASARTH